MSVTAYSGDIKRRTEVVGIFPNEDAIVRLIGAILLERNDEWRANTTAPATPRLGTRSQATIDTMARQRFDAITKATTSPPNVPVTPRRSQEAAGGTAALTPWRFRTPAPPTRESDN